MTVTLEETSGERRTRHTPGKSAGHNSRSHSGRANSDSSSLNSEEEDACRFVKDHISNALSDSGELCIGELLSAEAAVPLFNDINEVLSDVNSNIFTCDVTSQTENCAKIASAAVSLNDVLLSCDVKGDARTLASKCFYSGFYRRIKDSNSPIFKQYSIW